MARQLARCDRAARRLTLGTDMPVPGAATLSSILYGGWSAAALRAMVELRIADHLTTPATLQQLAAATSTGRSELQRLLRVLRSLDLVTVTAAGRYELTAAGALLVADRPGSARPMARLFTAPWQLRVLEQLPAAIRSGTALFADVHGCGFWEFLARNPDEAAMFDSAMTANGPGQAKALVEAIDFADVKTVVDVGGGKGSMLADLLAARPGLRGVVADRPEVVAASAPVLERAGVADRCEAVPADFFEEVPGGGEVYVLAQILHDWPEQDCRAILRTVRAAMSPGARLCVVEEVLDPATDGASASQLPLQLLDLAMLAHFGSGERTTAEYEALLGSSGFTDVVAHATGTAWTVLEAVPDPGAEAN